jgi:hypothetical protein
VCCGLRASRGEGTRKITKIFFLCQTLSCPNRDGLAVHAWCECACVSDTTRGDVSSKTFCLRAGQRHDRTHTRARAHNKTRRGRGGLRSTRRQRGVGAGAWDGDEECAFGHTNKTHAHNNYVQPRRATPKLSPLFLPHIPPTNRCATTQLGSTEQKGELRTQTRCARKCAFHYSKAKEEKEPVETPPAPHTS